MSNNLNKTIFNALTELGLGENEAILYKVLIENPNATIPLLKQKSPFSRTMLYYVLNNLKNYGLLTTNEEGKKTLYNAEPPEKLEEFMSQQEKELAKQKNVLKDVIGDLRSFYRLSHNRPGVKFFEGLKGVEEVTFDSLRAQDTIYTFADIEAVDKYVAEMNSRYVAARIKQKIHKKLIAPDTAATRAHYSKIPLKDRLLEVRLINIKDNPFKTGQQIYDKTISYSTLSPGNEMGVIIEDENIALMHRLLFEYIWNTLPAFQAARL